MTRWGDARRACARVAGTAVHLAASTSRSSARTRRSAYSPIPARFVNGELTVGENIGDLAGLAVAVRAYRLSLQGQPSPVIDGLNGEQRLFVRWAQIWRSKTRAAYLPQTLFLDQHAPPGYRAHARW